MPTPTAAISFGSSLQPPTVMLSGPKSIMQVVHLWLLYKASSCLDLSCSKVLLVRIMSSLVMVPSSTQQEASTRVQGMTLLIIFQLRKLVWLENYIKDLAFLWVLVVWMKSSSFRCTFPSTKSILCLKNIKTILFKRREFICTFMMATPMLLPSCQGS